MRKYTLKNICFCTVEQKLSILQIRNSDAVRKSMYSEHEIGVNEHLRWIERLLTDDRQKVFAVLKDGMTPIGVISVNQIDLMHKNADWAFYLDSSERGGVGAALEVFMLDYVFFNLKLEKLNCEVLETNPNVVEMHKKFGFNEEGFRAANIEKDSHRIGVHYLGMVRSYWKQNETEIKGGLKDRIDDIEICIDSEEQSNAQSVIDKIQAARSKNNVNWMNLLRLSVEKNPNQSLPIIDEIMRLDAEINELTGELVKK